MTPQPLLRGSDLIGMPIVDVTLGDDVAEVRDIVFDPSEGRLVGLTLNARGAFSGRLRAVLPIDGITSIGTDAVMVSGTDGFSGSEEHAGEAVAAARDAGNEVVENIVVTESGRTLGKVRDVIVRGGANPQVVAFEIGGGEVGSGLIPMSDHRGVSGSALIVPDEFETRVHSDLTGLASELADMPKIAQRGGTS